MGPVAELRAPGGSVAAGRTSGRVAGTVAGLLTTLSLLPALALAPPAAASVTLTAAPAAAQDVEVSLDSMNPAVIPRRGRVTLTGTLTNTTGETLRAINVHPLTSYSPLTTAREVQVAVESDPESSLGGSRLTETGLFDNVRDLAPGARATWRVSIPRSELQISGEEGVYWIGVQVLATDDTGVRDIHGRARSFIPLVDRSRRAVPTSLILPVRRVVERTADGKVGGTSDWAEELQPGGRLANLTDFVRSSGTAPVTWLIDPAVLDAVDQLASGNPARSLEPTLPPPGEEGEGDEDGEQQSEEEAAADGSEPDDALPEARRWLDALTSLTARNPVLALPYGDLDVAAASRYEPTLYNRARTLSEQALTALAIESTPALVPPSGLINPTALAQTPFTTDVFLSEEALGVAYDDPADAPATVESGGHRITVTDHTIGLGGPGPDARLAPVALRQRMLAEAAVRALSGDTSRFTVDLPFDFDPGTNSGAFFRGLEQPFLDIVPASVDRAGEVPEVAKVNYPTRQVVRELNEANVRATQQFLEAGQRLDSILTRNDALADVTLREALCTSSYLHRDDPVAGQVGADIGAGWLRTRLERVSIEAPSFVILSSDSGPFAVTVSNGLDQPVRIRIQAQTNDDVVIRAPEEITLEADTQQSVELSAEAGAIGVHPVRLVATDADGQPLGSVDEIDIRANTVGKMIWVIMGVGVGILAISIPVRWVRRFRRSGEAA